MPASTVQAEPKDTGISRKRWDTALITRKFASGLTERFISARMARVCWNAPHPYC